MASVQVCDMVAGTVTTPGATATTIITYTPTDTTIDWQVFVDTVAA